MISFPRSLPGTLGKNFSPVAVSALPLENAGDGGISSQNLLTDQSIYGTDLLC